MHGHRQPNNKQMQNTMTKQKQQSYSKQCARIKTTVFEVASQSQLQMHDRGINYTMLSYQQPC
jgi:hypothetical protein